MYQLKTNNFRNSTNKLLFDDIDISNFVQGSLIGKGSFATVKLCHLKNQSNYKLAIKTYEKFRLKEPSVMKNLLKEINILQQNNHVNILKLFFCIEDSRQVHLITEYIDSNLNSYMKKQEDRKLNEEQSRYILRQIVEGMKYLHDKNIIHRDLKLENILYCPLKNEVKIIDLGFATQIIKDQKMEVYCGTPQYMSPQIVRQKPFEGKAADVWAMGVVLFTLTHGRNPFKAVNEKYLYQAILNQDFSIDPTLSSSLADLIRAMLHPDEAIRITTNQILAHSFFTTHSSSNSSII